LSLALVDGHVEAWTGGKLQATEPERQIGIRRHPRDSWNGDAFAVSLHQMTASMTLLCKRLDTCHVPFVVL
ncbi:hypothetical protein LSAT2_031090, partial [Lamellibrachia satsuma]